MSSDSVIRAAGGILWRTAPGTNGDSAIEVAIIHRPRYGDWSFPKGKLNPGEIEIEGAVREILEETGYRVTVGPPIGDVKYEKDGRPKVVRYWSMQAAGGMFDPSREVDELRWLPVPDALNLLNQERDRDLLRQFAAGPTATRSVLLTRHGSAGNRSGWNGNDVKRPLDDRGHQQADALVWLLTRWDVREIVSAPVLRCTQTVEPLSVAVGLQVQEEAVLSENAYPGHEDAALELVRSVGSPGTGTVLCSQGGVIPDLLTRLAAEDDYKLEEPLEAKKGSVWSLTFDAGRLYCAEYFPPLV